MHYSQKVKLNGFTLFELLLVLAIITSILLMMTTYMTTKTDESKRDFTAIQYEQILNAGLAYYISFSKWPNNDTDLKTNNYLPTKTIISPWRNTYSFFHSDTTGVFSICSLIPKIEAGILAGRLPMAYVAATCDPDSSSTGATLPPAPLTSACTSTTCGVVASVNIPGQNLNNARSVNFASLYHNGACVPAPACPNAYNATTNPTGMKPAIMVVPASVSGNFDGDMNVYPLSSFTAYAVGVSATDSSPAISPGKCTDSVAPTPCLVGSDGSMLPTGGKYWRVCLDVVTEKGRISGATWNENSGTIMAITRCVPNNEPIGSGFSVFQSF